MAQSSITRAQKLGKKSKKKMKKYHPIKTIVNGVVNTGTASFIRESAIHTRDPKVMNKRRVIRPRSTKKLVNIYPAIF